jgi:hypothetical protein
MAQRGRVYPQVELRARDIVDLAVTACPMDLSAAEALGVARRRQARALIGFPIEDRRSEASRRGKVRREHGRRRELILVAHVERAVAVGLGSLPVRHLAIPVGVVEATASEVAARRQLLHGAAAVLVTQGERMIGGIGRAALRGSEPVGVSLAPILRTRLPADTVSRITALARDAERRGRRAFLIGDAVRDAMLAALMTAAPVASAATTPAACRSNLRSSAGCARATFPGGRFGRGAKPPSESLEVVDHRAGTDTLETSLARRGFTIDAMAVELSSGTFGLVDPFGGRHDAIRRRLRVVDPLAFVDDPGLAARAAAWTALGFRLDAAARRARAVAAGRRTHRAYSGRARVAPTGPGLPRPPAILRLLRSGDEETGSTSVEVRVGRAPRGQPAGGPYTGGETKER